MASCLTASDSLFMACSSWAQACPQSSASVLERLPSYTQRKDRYSIVLDQSLSVPSEWACSKSRKQIKGGAAMENSQKTADYVIRICMESKWDHVANALLGGVGFRRRCVCWARRSTLLRALRRLARHWKSCVSTAGVRTVMRGRRSADSVHPHSTYSCQ